MNAPRLTRLVGEARVPSGPAQPRPPRRLPPAGMTLAQANALLVPNELPPALAQALAAILRRVLAEDDGAILPPPPPARES